ncbi:MAG TPA: SWIM zinc finger family protein [Planctomycetota bacterium]|jgi:hypothetical protein
MELHYRYSGKSDVINGLRSSELSFATNTLREATFFEGALRNPLLLREALAALYHVVISDYKYHPRDREAFFAWLASQDRKFLAGLGTLSKESREEMTAVTARLSDLDAAHHQRLEPFYGARKAFFDYIYQNQYELMYLLDPVVTVHPDEISFEAFSRDESTYARLAAKHELFNRVGSFECGTTNIDFSSRLHAELDRLRSYRETRFEVAPSGFTVASQQGALKEKKIDLPESWLMGFLQVHSTMCLSLAHVTLEPIDLFNISRFLRRHRTKVSPRALRFELYPGAPARVVLEPWNYEIPLMGTAVYDGPKPQTIRTWGRDRLQTLARLVPVCRKVDLYLAGEGMPTIYVLDLGPITFTLALSGWTDNDWTGGSRFSLLARRMEVSADELTQTYHRLREERFATPSALAQRTGLGLEKTRSALSYLCQIGRGMYDLHSGLYRHRDLFMEPFSAQVAVGLAEKALEESDPKAKEARNIFVSDRIRIIARRPVSTGYKLSGSAKGADNQTVRPLVHVDHQGKIIEASCTCAYWKKHKLTQGPCEHILALRLAHMNRLEQEQ